MLLFGYYPAEIWPGYCGRGDATRTNEWLLAAGCRRSVNARKQQPSIVGQKLNTFDDGCSVEERLLWHRDWSCPPYYPGPACPGNEGMYRAAPWDLKDVPCLVKYGLNHFVCIYMLFDSQYTVWHPISRDVLRFFVQKFRLWIGLHNGCTIRPPAGVSCQIYFTKYHDWWDAKQCKFVGCWCK